VRKAERLAYKWRVMITVAVGVWMIVLDSTVVNVAFPTLRRTFGTGIDQAQWVISIYVLALGIATPLAGFLADRFGMKRIYSLGLTIFVVGSFLSGLAPSFSTLVAARAVQGFGGGIAQPLSVAMLFMAFPPREQGHAFGIFGIVMVGAPALGPIIGGLLVDRDLWRWIFYINRLFDKIGPRALVVTGSLLLLVNSWQFARLTAATAIQTILVLLALRGMAISLIMQATFTTALGAVPHRSVPRASSLVNSTRFIAQALGVALLATVLGSAVSRDVQAMQEEQAREGLAGAPGGLCGDAGREHGPLLPDDRRQKACDENLQGLRRAYMVTFYAAWVALVTGAFLPGWPSKWTGRRELWRMGADDAS
jgi:MFS family permease